MTSNDTLYSRLGGYEGVVEFEKNLIERMMADEVIGRFWQHRGADGLDRENQLVVNFLSHNAGGPVYYTGRDMATTHRGMRISEDDWHRFIELLNDTIDHFDLPDTEKGEVLGFIESIKGEIVEA